MYFPNAFRKSFLPASTTLATTGGTDALTAGQIGFFDAKTYQVVSAQAAPFILAQGSYFAADKIGPVHGGYKESVNLEYVENQFGPPAKYQSYKEVDPQLLNIVMMIQ